MTIQEVKEVLKNLLPDAYDLLATGGIIGVAMVFKLLAAFLGVVAFGISIAHKIILMKHDIYRINKEKELDKNKEIKVKK